MPALLGSQALVGLRSLTVLRTRTCLVAGVCVCVCCVFVELSFSYATVLHAWHFLYYGVRMCLGRDVLVESWETCTDLHTRID